MPKELDWQYKIIKSVRVQGGYGKKWSSTYAVGVPDLILSHPSFGVLFMEVKLEHNIKDGFDRQVGATKRQRHEMALLEGAGAQCAVGVVVYRSPRDARLVCLSSQARRVQDGALPWAPWRGAEGFDMVSLIKTYIDGEY